MEDRTFCEATRSMAEGDPLRVSFDLDAVVAFKEMPDGKTRIILDTDSVLDLALDYDDFRVIHNDWINASREVREPWWFRGIPSPAKKEPSGFWDIPSASVTAPAGDHRLTNGDAETREQVETAAQELYEKASATFRPSRESEESDDVALHFNRATDDRIGDISVPDPVEHHPDPVEPEEVVETLRESGYDDETIAVRLQEEVLVEKPDEEFLRFPYRTRVVINREASPYYGDRGRVIGENDDIRLVRLDGDGHRTVHFSTKDLLLEAEEESDV